MTDTDSITLFKGIDLTGQRFGRLTVTSRAPSRLRNNGKFRTMWHCLCECGGTALTPSDMLRSGRTQSCGCLRREMSSERSAVHRQTDTPTYRTWARMKSRCFNPQDGSFADYGGRGIRMCDRWHTSFLAFAGDVGERPSRKHSIDRIDNDGWYSCGKCQECVSKGLTANCKWSTRVEQCNNRRSSHYVTINDRTQTIAEWCRELKIPVQTAQSRITRGWDDVRALLTPVRTATLYCFQGRSQTLTQWSKECGISAKILRDRMARYYWTFEKSLTTPNRCGNHNTTERS